MDADAVPIFIQLISSSIVNLREQVRFGIALSRGKAHMSDYASLSFSRQFSKSTLLPLPGGKFHITV